MRIGIITPAPPRSRYGNRVTALRWARILRKLGHRVTVAQAYEDQPYDILVALHARRSFDSIRRFRRDCPDAPLIVALTGTDLYRDIHTSATARRALELATRLVVLQPKGLEELRPELRSKVRVIYQSVRTTYRGAGRRAHPRRSRSLKSQISNVESIGRFFTVCVIGHLRPVKDPLRAALAARSLRDGSRVRVLHIGGAMTDEMARRARAEMKVNTRYRWLGEQPAWRVRLVISDSDL
ncbi:MAG TPA: hypothetical protein VJH03_24325 [Blastocatellia bacterium]|nr:hypothetical protein [Blastocatellia bacterium]